MEQIKLYYGAGYSDEAMTPGRVEQDISLMKQAGMNLIRIGGGAWPCWESEEGKYDFTSLHRVLAQASGLSVFVELSLADIPEWLRRKNGDITAYAERYLRELLEQCRPYDCVSGFQLDVSGLLSVALQAKLLRKFGRTDLCVTFDRSHAVDSQTAESAAELTDLVGCGVFHSSGLRNTGAELSLQGDIARSAKKSPYFVLKTQCQGRIGELPYPGQLRLSAFHHLASGAAGVVYERWYSDPAGECKGVLSYGGISGRAYRETAAIGAEITRLADHLGGMKKQNRVAIIRSESSASHLKLGSGKTYEDVFRWVYDSFYRYNVEVDVIPDTQRDFTGYELLVVPALYCAEDNLIWAIRDFVDGGGQLIATFRSFFADENGEIRSDAQPYGMTDVFGMTYDEYTVPDGISLPEFSWAVTDWMELLQPQAARSVAKYAGPGWGGMTGVTCSRFGKGNAAYIGCYTQDGLDVILERLLKQWHILVPEITWPVVMKRGVSAAGKPLTYLLHYSDATTVIPCPGAGVELLSGTYMAEREPLELKPWDVKILEGNV